MMCASVKIKLWSAGRKKQVFSAQHVLDKINIPSAKLHWNEFSRGTVKVLNSCRENKTHREENA